MSSRRRFVVIGNPVAHSLSPRIHAAFSEQTGIALEYTTLQAPLQGFDAAARRFFDEGGSGANVTLPFKIDALRFADEVSGRARRAGAANVLASADGRIRADNTDGAGLVGDLTRNLGRELRAARVLLLGAGGAARGVIAPLLALQPAALVVANRTVERARDLAREFAELGPIRPGAIDAIEGAPFDIVVNATSTSTKGEPLALPHGVFAPGALAYDMAYGPAARGFVDRARALGVAASDGLGMLVEQAAEAFLVWHGRRPETAEVLKALRAA